jgi:hypothetical protein
VVLLAQNIIALHLWIAFVDSTQIAMKNQKVELKINFLKNQDQVDLLKYVFKLCMSSIIPNIYKQLIT